MTTTKDLLRGMRTWIRAAARTVPLTEKEIINADTSNVRPPLPYLTVRLLTYDVRIGTDEVRPGLDVGGDPTVSVRGQRRATVTVQAFGDEATEWLMNAVVSLQLPAIRAILEAEKIGVEETPGGQSNIAAVLADQTELRGSYDFDIVYTFETVTPEIIEDIQNIELTITLESDVSTDLIVNIP